MIIRFNQFLGTADGAGAIYTTHSRQIKLKNTAVNTDIDGERYGLVHPAEAFYVSKLANLDTEVFSLGLVIRVNEKPMKLVTERLLYNEEIDSHDPEN